MWIFLQSIRKLPGGTWSNSHHCKDHMAMGASQLTDLFWSLWSTRLPWHAGTHSRITPAPHRRELTGTADQKGPYTQSGEVLNQDAFMRALYGSALQVSSATPLPWGHSTPLNSCQAHMFFEASLALRSRTASLVGGEGSEGGCITARAPAWQAGPIKASLSSGPPAAFTPSQ